MTEWIRSGNGEPQGFDDFVSLQEAALILRVSEVTLRRWINQDRIRAYRFGPKRIRLRRTDLESLMTPTREEMPDAVPTSLRLIPMGVPQDDAALLASVRKLHGAQRRKQRGKPQPEAWEDINWAREERSRQL